jgi:carbamoyltransferase
MIILGINAYHGDASAAIVVDGRLVAAVEEERFNRIKHWAGFPVESIRYCLQTAGVELSELDHVAVSRNPSAHLHKKILYSVRNNPSLDLIRNRLANASKIHDLRSLLSQSFDVDPAKIAAKFHNVEHHRAHLASSFFASSFDQAALLSVDGFGDFVSCMWGSGRGSQMDIAGWVEFPHSIGILYTAITQFLGFPKYGDEYKVMGLASYGEPEYELNMRSLLRATNGMDFELDLRYFQHHSQGVQMTWDAGYPELSNVYSTALSTMFGKPRSPQDLVERHHQNIAASLQRHLEETLFHMLNTLAESTRSENLCMAGGVALNCVANGKITDRTPFRRIYIQPAANDSGTSIGAALYVHHALLKNQRQFQMDHAYWGPEYPERDLEREIESAGLPYRKMEPGQLVQWTAGALTSGKVLGWYQGRMEFGPRALGNRSILVDPRRPDMKDVLNSRIKHREPFRPFAPAIKEESTADYFEKSDPSPFMLMTYNVWPQKRSAIPAPTHVDGTGRLQTVSQSQNPLFWQLLDAFERQTGVPVLLNTSFNENEPIVNNPREALDCFRRTKMDALVLGPFVMEKDPSP